MSNRRKIQSQSVFNEESLHFRLCHGCWHLNESNSEVTQCEQCHRAFPTQITQELFEGMDAFASGLMPGNGLEEEAEEEDDPFEEEEDGGLEDSVDYQRSGFGVTGLSVRW